MLQLPNGCSCSGTAGNPGKNIPDELSVYPANWKSNKASLAKPWYIQYYFYDPSPEFKKEYPKGKLVISKVGINKFKTWNERYDVTRLLMKEMLSLLKDEGYNPWDNSVYNTPGSSSEISKDTLILNALEFAREKIDNSCSTDVRSVLKYTTMAIESCRFYHIPVSQFQKKHIKLTLDQVEKMKRTGPPPTEKGKKNHEWTNNTFNYYRSHLRMVFEKLLEYDVIEANPVDGIKKKKHTKSDRELLTKEERKLISNHLHQKNYNFWRFMQIFFHSGAREAELMRVQAKHVDIENQRCRMLILKGDQSKWVWKTIKTSVVDLWKEVLHGANPEDFVFSKKLQPGSVSISPRQITIRWRVHVKAPENKGGLGIQKDFYGLKHLNLDETAAELNVTMAQKMADHTTPVITLKHYLPGQDQRNHEQLKKVSNTFS